MREKCIKVIRKKAEHKSVFVIMTLCIRIRRGHKTNEWLPGVRNGR